ncbi:MAG: glycosyltransferase, partial [Peptostreptococcaceae bacterium]
ISDDCSEEFNHDEIEKIKLYIEKNKKENIVNYEIHKNEKNEGTVKNLNKCIRSSKGEYLIVLSCDDCFYDENVVCNIVNYFESSSYMIATSKYYKQSNDTKDGDIISMINWRKRLMMEEPLKLYVELCKGNFISGANLYYTRDFINKYGLYDEEYMILEDYSKLLNITRKGCKIGFIDEITITRRSGGAATTLSNYKMSKEKKNNVIAKIKQDQKIIQEKEIKPYLETIKEELKLRGDH